MYRLRITAAAVLCAAAPLSLAACSSKSGPAHSAATRAAGRQATSIRVAGRQATSTSFCQVITKNNAIITDIAAGDQRPNGVDVQKLMHDLQAAADAAPAEISSDMRTVVDFDRGLIVDHKDIKETPQLEAALEHYVRWVGTHCAGR